MTPSVKWDIVNHYFRAVKKCLVYMFSWMVWPVWTSFSNRILGLHHTSKTRRRGGRVGGIKGVCNTEARCSKMACKISKSEFQWSKDQGTAP